MKVKPASYIISISEDLRVRLLRQVLLATALLAVIYSLVSVAGLVRAYLYPWDGLGLLVLSGVCLLLERRGQIILSATLLVNCLLYPIAFSIQHYGIRHPINAFAMLGILVAGLLLGSRGFIGAYLAMSSLIAAFGIAELSGVWPALNPVSSWFEWLETVVFWWVLFGLGSWLTWLFARNLEQAVAVARGHTAALAQTLTILAHRPNLEELTGEVLDAAARLMGVEHSALFSHDPKTGRIRLLQADPPLKEGTPEWPAAEDLLLVEMIRNGRAVHVDDPHNDPRIKDRQTLLEAGIQTVLYVPLRLDDTVWSYLRLGRTNKQRFGSEEIELALALAQQVSLSARLSRFAEQAGQAAITEERNRMAREMHDTLAQGFTGIIVQLEAAEDALDSRVGAPNVAIDHLDRARNLARQSLADARRSVWALRPQALVHEDLEAALRRHAAQLTAGTNLVVEVSVRGEPRSLAPDYEANLLRIGQEALTNVLNHSGASQVTIELSYLPDSISLRVQDNGQGFASPPDTRSSGHFGLHGMRERAAKMHGTLETNSRPGQGTMIICRVPLGEKAT